MFGYQWHTILGWVLASILSILLLQWASSEVFAVAPPQKLGIAVEIAPEGGDAAKNEDDAPVDLGTLLASADIAKGERQAKNCTSCHNFTNGGPNAIGPNLWGVVGRNVAQHEGFTYSAAFKTVAQAHPVWTYEELFQFLAAPSKYAQGTAMSFAGIRKPEDRANLLAYLNTQTSAPLAFPAPVAAPTEPGAGEPTVVAAPANESASEDGAAPAGPVTPETADNSVAAAPR